MKFSRIFAVAVSLLLVVGLCLGPAGAVPGAGQGAVSIVVHDDLTTEEIERLGATVVENYGGFVLIQGPPVTAARLSGAGIACEVLSPVIHLRAGAINPMGKLAVVPADLRQTGTGLQLVQLIGPVKAEWVDELEALGDIYDYIPNFTYVMNLKPGAASSIGKLDFVQWVGAYHPAYRIHPDVAAGKVDEVLISFYGEADQSALEDRGLTIAAGSGDSVIARGNLAAIKSVARMHDVAFIEPWLEPELFNNIARQVIRADYVHGKGIVAQGQIGAVTDTGVYLAHECFSEPNKIVTFIDVAGDSGSSGGDGHGHGTHCAGSVLGDAPLYQSYNLYDGQGLGARLIPVKVFNNSGWWAGGNNYYGFWQSAYNAGARVNSNSWGSNSGGAYGASDSDADRVTRDNRDYVLVIAAGNAGGNGPQTTGSPANAKNVITVGALVTNSPEDVASFSSRGPTRDARIKPDVMAPGSYIRSAQRGTTSGYTNMQGTSMACPQVAGAALLVRDYFVRGFYPTGSAVPNNGFNPTASLVKAILINGAVEITGVRSDWNNENRFPNNAQGWGSVNLERSLFFTGDSRRVTVWDSPVNLSTGQVWATAFNLPEAHHDLKFTLTWTDHWAASGASVTIQNDLHLRVIAPDGTVFRGNNFANQRNPGYSIPGGSFDVRNTVEGIHLLPGLSFPGGGPVVPGLYQIEVIANNVPQGTQDFALVVSTGPTSFDPDPPPGDTVALMGDYNNDMRDLLQSAGYDVIVYGGSDYAAVINNLDNIAVVVLHRVSNNSGFNDLLNAANQKQKGLVFTSQYSFGSYGLGVLRSRYGDPANMNQHWARGQVRLRVMANHPIFQGYPAGTTVTIINGGDNDFQSFSGYSGTIIGENMMDRGLIGMVAFKDRADTGGARHALMASFGSCLYTRVHHWTADGRNIFFNAVDWAGNL